MQREPSSLKLGVNGGRPSAGRRWRAAFRRGPEMRNPMLVMNMSIFNFGGGWNRIIRVGTERV
jgi:hypothetical protein